MDETALLDTLCAAINRTRLGKSAGSSPGHPEATIEECCLELRKYLSSLRSKSISQKKSAEKVRFIILVISDCISALTVTGESSKLKDLEQEPHVFDSLQGLLGFIEISFQDVIPPELYIPQIRIYYIMRTELHFREQLIEKLQPATISDEFKQLLVSYISCLSGEGSFRLKTYYDLFYYKRFCNKLDELLRAGAEEDDINAFPFGLNFNSIHFYKLFVDRIQRKLDLFNSYKEQRAYLIYMKKCVNQYPVLASDAYDPQVREIRLSITSYLTEEISFIKKTEHLHNETFFNAKSRKAYPFYFHMAFTVAQLNFFFNLLVDSGIIITKRKADLHEFIVNHIGTLKKDNLSGHSVKNKSYGPSDSVVRKVKDQLIKMINIINEKY